MKYYIILKSNFYLSSAFKKVNVSHNTPSSLIILFLIVNYNPVINILFPSPITLSPHSLSLSLAALFHILFLCVCMHVCEGSCQVYQTLNMAVLHVHVTNLQSRLVKKKLFPLLQRWWNRDLERSGYWKIQSSVPDKLECVYEVLGMLLKWRCLLSKSRRGWRFSLLNRS